MSRPRITVLLSTGTHPESGRPRAAASDGQALGLALSVGEVVGLHAGEPADRVLWDYLAMGLARIEVLPTNGTEDVVPGLAAVLRDQAPDLIVAGDRAENGVASGLTAYRLAEVLGRPLVAGVTGLQAQPGTATFIRAAGGHGVERISTVLPAVVVVDGGAPPAPGHSHRLRVSGRVVTLPPLPGGPPGHRIHPTLRPLRHTHVPNWIARPDMASAAARIAAIRDASARGGEVLSGLPPEAAARAILESLRRQGLVGDPAAREDEDDPAL